MLETNTFSDRHIETKEWGFEEWIINNNLYCGKRLHFTKLHGSTSLHFHAKKHETMYVEQGLFSIITCDTTTGTQATYKIASGCSIVIPQLTPHRIVAEQAGSILIEFSTHHENSDSYRIHR